MRLAATQILDGAAKRLFPVYLVSGDEPLQHGEALDAIRGVLKKSGYANREIFDVESGFNWPRFEAAARSVSIFSENKLVELRFGFDLPDKKAQSTIVSFLEHIPPATVLLLSCGKVQKNATKAAWFTAVDRIGAIVQVWPLQNEKYLAWIDARAKSRGLRLDSKALRLLASRVEGNLLAAAQEIDKLGVLHGSALIEVKQVAEVVADGAHFDVFELVDSLLAGQPVRGDRILSSLRADGTAIQIVLWALARELRLLAKLRFELDHGGNRATLYAKHAVWENRKPLVDAALRRLGLKRIQSLLSHCATIDRMGKGFATGDAWEELLLLSLAIAGSSPLDPVCN